MRISDWSSDVCSSDLPPARGLGIGGRRIARRRFHQSRDDRRFLKAQPGGGMAEEAAARRVDAIGPAAEIDAVQIQLQDLLLAELAFHRHGEDDLAELAGEFARVREEDVAGKLLRDGDRKSTRL